MLPSASNTLITRVPATGQPSRGQRRPRRSRAASSTVTVAKAIHGASSRQPSPCSAISRTPATNHQPSPSRNGGHTLQRSPPAPRAATYRECTDRHADHAQRVSVEQRPFPGLRAHPAAVGRPTIGGAARPCSSQPANVGRVRAGAAPARRAPHPAAPTPRTVQRVDRASGTAAVAKPTASTPNDCASRRIPSRRISHAARRDVEHGYRERAVRQSHAVSANKRRPAETPAAACRTPGCRRRTRGAAFAAQRVQHRDRDVEQEEPGQERQHRGQQFRPVVAVAPSRADREGEREADQVQRAPRPEPRNAEHREVEHRVVRKQRHVVAAAGADQHRRR